MKYDIGFWREDRIIRYFEKRIDAKSNAIAKEKAKEFVARKNKRAKDGITYELARVSRVRFIQEKVAIWEHESISKPVWVD